MTDTQPSLTLYHFPGACSRVTVCALEMAELDYSLELIDITTGQQGSDAYLRISPLGKIPMLDVDGMLLAENAAILTFIAGLRPDSGVFPRDPSNWTRAEVIGGLSFCAGTLHPQIRGLANPSRLTVGDTEAVREKSRALAEKSFGYAERRMAERSWWIGELSIVDVYLDWAFGVARNAGFDVSPYPHLLALSDRLAEVPAYVRMQAEEARSRAALGR